VKDLFSRANETLGFDIAKIILEGPIEKINLTENTQPAIFIVSFSIYSVISKEFNIDLTKGKYFAGHSLGEYSALTCAGALKFEDTVKLLNERGKSMQSAVPLGEGGMLAILGQTIDEIENIILSNDDFKSNCQIANDNSPGQVVVSGKLKIIKNLQEILKSQKIKSVILPVSAPFHSFMMKKSTEIMTPLINSNDFNKPRPKIISNVTSEEADDVEQLKSLLIKQIESRVRWRESINYMVKNNVSKFIEIGPGKVLCGLLKRIDKNLKAVSINSIEDIKQIGDL
jgi:[acyl-carrier-protein] S-malonyltransferase